VKNNLKIQTFRLLLCVFVKVCKLLFTESFKKYNWGYLFYDDIIKLKSLKNISESNIRTFLNYF